MSAPVLRTVLDLREDELREMDPLGVLAMRTFVDQEKRAGLRGLAPASKVAEFDFLDEVPATARILADRLALRRPETLVSAVLMGQLTADSRNAGSAVLWAHALAAWAARTGKPASVTSVLVHHLGGRLPSEQGYRALWEEQKNRDPQRTGGDNWLDYAEVWTDSALRAAQVGRGEEPSVAPSGG